VLYKNNNNLKLLPTEELRISTFHKAHGRIPKRLCVPLAVNPRQRTTFHSLLQLDKYSIVVKRKLVKGEVRFYVHVSYEAPEPKIRIAFQHGAIGLDFNYNFIILVNIDKDGNFLSYQQIPFRNLHSYRKGRRDDYASFKLDKVIQYYLNKGKGLILEALSFDQSFSYNKKRNRKLHQFKTSMISLLERKCARHGIAVRKVHPAYATIIGALKYSWSFNFSDHVLASYVIARKGLGIVLVSNACDIAYKKLEYYSFLPIYKIEPLLDFQAEFDLSWNYWFRVFNQSDPRSFYLPPHQYLDDSFGGLVEIQQIQSLPQNELSQLYSTLIEPVQKFFPVEISPLVIL